MDLTKITLKHFANRENLPFLSYWIPRRIDICMIRNFFISMKCTNILDIGCSSGFISCLLTGDGLQVHGVDTDDRISHSPFRKPGFTFQVIDAYNITGNVFDGVFLSWADQQSNPASAVLRQNPKAIVYVIETSGLTGDPQNRYITDILPYYRPYSYWDNINCMDLSSFISRLNSSVRNAALFPKSSHNRVILFIRRDIPPGGEKMNYDACHEYLQRSYPWEKELDKYFKTGEHIDSGRKILWKISPVIDEGVFVRKLNLENALCRGFVM